MEQHEPTVDDRDEAATPYDPAADRKTFGRRLNVGVVKFDVIAYDDRLDADITHTFTAYKDPGSGPILSFMRARDSAENAAAAAALIYRALVDNDGLSVDYIAPTDEEIDQAREDGESFEDAAARLVDPRVDDETQWSSRCRFAELVEDEHRRLDGDLINDLAEWLVELGTGRPTGQPSRSTRGPASTRRGSRARR